MCLDHRKLKKRLDAATTKHKSRNVIRSERDDMTMNGPEPIMNTSNVMLGRETDVKP